MTESKLIKEATKILQKRSEKSLETAKKMVLNEEIECKEITEAFKYYTENWYDYVHPGLISIACEAVNGDPDDSIPVQVAMLLLTAAVDLHDDLIDESKTKYGKPTLLGKFGKNVTLLVGDVFMIKAFSHLHKLEEQFSQRKINMIWDVIRKQFFILGNAEAIETSLKGDIDFSPEEYMRILEKKASSFEIHTRIGAIIGGGRQKEIDVLGCYGRTFGVLIAVRDDFIDVFEPEELQNRMKNELLPLPILCAFKNPKTKKALLSILSKPKISDNNAQKIVDIIFNEREVKLFEERIQQLSGKTLKDITTLPSKNVASQMKILIEGLKEDL